jgi:sugar (pentulose or hexulose) kinase
MTSSQATALCQESKHTRSGRNALEKAWASKERWSRTYSARFLNDRSEALIALFRRAHQGQLPRHTRQFGYWLKQHAPALFERAHVTLAACADDNQRERLLPTDLL